MATISFQDFLNKAGGSIADIKPVSRSNNEESKSSSLFGVPSGRQLVDSTKDVFTGMGKGLIQSGTGLIQGVNDIGTGVQAAINPNETYGSLKQKQNDMGSIFSGSKADEINSQLKSKNTGETVGKSLEFIAELLTPTGVRSAVTKGSGLFKNISSKVGAISDDVMEGGSKLKDRIIDTLTSLDDKTKTALSRTPKEKLQEVVQKGRDALLDDRNRTPLEAVGDNIISGLKQIKDKASSIGSQKSAYLDKAKIGLQRVGTIGREAALNVKRQFAGMKLDASEKKVITNFFNYLKSISKNPTLKEVDQVIDLLQDTLYKTGRNSVVEVTDRVVGPLRKILGELNSKASDIGGEVYKRFNSQYKDLIEIVGELNARVGKEGASAGSFVKRLFSPSDARTKELFEQLQKYTGQDYFRDARLSKFVMETLGDTRAASLLEQLPNNISGMLSGVIDYGKKKLADPIKAAERFIDKVK